MANPMLNERTFGRVEHLPPRAGAPGWSDQPGASSAPWATTSASTMTIGGTCSAAGLMLAVLGAGAWFGWGLVRVTDGIDQLGRVVSTAELLHPVGLIVAVGVAFALAILTAFVPKAARFTALPYAAAEGVVLGAVSHLYEAQSKGIALQAVIATCGVFAMMLLLYGLRILRATPAFTKGVIAATFGVAAIYLVAWIARLFGADLGIFDSTSGVSILFSVVVVGIAALNLILDFNFIERGSAEGLPKHMEWYGAFALVLTIVWLYLELLRLLSKLNRR